ncbi:MAG: hypothetical protein ABR564_07565 [Candidatus Dormibacteria bacterium]
MDGNHQQIAAITKQAKARGVSVHIIVDFVHVLEYLWKATWCFHQEGDPAAEAWVRKAALGVLAGKATAVAGTVRRRATRAGLEPDRRKGVDACATYLSNKSAYLDYPKALQEGWPIATGVIEGACRHLVKDRMLFRYPHNIRNAEDALMPRGTAIPLSRAVTGLKCSA